MKPEDIEILRMLVHARSGVVVDPAKTYLIESRLGPVARREGFSSIMEMLAAIRTHRDEALMWAATEAMTSTETSFFRDADVFDMFRQEILPRLAAARSTSQPIRIWSAACASGQEPFSLAMALDAETPKMGGAKVELFASDLSEACLEKAQSGLYTQFEIQRGLPVKLLIRHFEKTGEMWRFQQRLSSSVRFRRINLLADLKALGQFDAVFCRYALNQFDAATRRRVLDQLAALLPPDGYLVLGANEGAEGIEGLRALGRGVFTRDQSLRVAA